MIVDFFRHGTGLSKGCLDYMLGEDRAREHALVLNGDVELTAQLIDSSPYTKKYTSGCLSFYEHDLTEPDKQKIMQDFEQCLFPGLDQDQYNILWIQHQDKKNEATGETRLELNFVIPNVELSTGKRLQPFYAPVDLDRVDLFKQITNTEHQLYDPDDPDHRQLFLNKKNMPKDVKDFKERLHQRIYRAVENGDVSDRQTLVHWLESNEIKVTRQVKQSISIENPYEDGKRPIRLEGEIYEQSFSATREYRQEVQQRISEYRGTTSERYRANVTDYQRQLDHKSQYHSDRYPTIGRESRQEHTEQLENSRRTAQAVRSLADIEIEPFTATQRADRERREPSTESEPQKETFHFEYRTDFDRSYSDYGDFLYWLSQQRQIQRDPNPEQRDRRKTSDSRPSEQIGGKPEYQHMQTEQQQNPALLYPDQRETGTIRERLLHSNGVLNDDRIRNTVIENHRRTTEAITSTTSAVAEATADFRYDAEQDYSRLINAVTDNQQQSGRLTASTKVISDNTDAISRARQKHSKLYQPDQWQSNRNEPDHDQQRKQFEDDFKLTSVSVIRSRTSTAELTQNFSAIAESLRAIAERKLERQREVEQPRPKQDRGMDFGM